MIAATEHTERASSIDGTALAELGAYWSRVREVYAPFESGLKGATGTIYDHEMPGGQYSNLAKQCQTMGLGDRWEELKRTYKEVDLFFGRLIKVTPTSKVVGDLALYLLSQNLSVEDLGDTTKNLLLPASVIGFLRGEIGVPYGGLPKEATVLLSTQEEAAATKSVQLKRKECEAELNGLLEEHKHEGLGDIDLQHSLLSYGLYPAVYTDFVRKRTQFGPVDRLPSSAYFLRNDLLEKKSSSISNSASV